MQTKEYLQLFRLTLTVISILILQVEMLLRGSPEELDRKLGRLLWLGGYLQRRKLKFDVLAYTGAGQRMWHIGTAHTLKDAMNGLLAEEPMEQSHMESPETAGQWQFYIGGEADEAP